MSKEVLQEDLPAWAPSGARGASEASTPASDYGDSFLKEVLHVKPASRLPVPGQWLGGSDGRRFEILEPMGRGGMGQVFRARDATLRREVALKFLLPRSGFEALALAEARAVARLDHENIVRIFDVAEWSRSPGQPPVPFLVMECLEGESLAGLLRRERPGLPRALGILEAVAAGLAHAHERGIVHRDLKPGNVFLTRQGAVKLLDFGLSHLAVEPVRSELQPQGGTPAYMAPEQWLGEPQDARTDIWAAGVVLYEMLTGETPFQAASLAELRERVTSPRPAPAIRVHHPEVPRRVALLLATALAREPARRFSSALELREEVRELRGRLFGSGREGRGPSAEPQRRQVTLVSCQLAGLAGNGARLDAEDEGELETAFHEVCVELIEGHGGSVVLSMGGEVLASFGWSQGREDDSERAVRAALQLTRELGNALQHRLPHLPLSGLHVHGGVHTEWMTVGARLQGEAPRVAAWLARRAGPGGVAVSDRTWTLVRGAFEGEALGAHTFEGLSGGVSMGIHRVRGEREVASRFERAQVAGRLSPLVGRERELGWLLALWERSRRGQGAFVLVSGEAGIGKSRLIQALCERVEASSKVIRVQCWSRYSTHALHPLIEMLQVVVGIRPEDPPPLRLRKLEEGLRALGIPWEDSHLLALLLELPVPEDSPALRLTPERRRERTFEALACIFTRCPCEYPPELLVIEDLHWADSTLLEFLGYLLENLSNARTLIVLSARSELPLDWPRREGVHRLVLERLPAALAADLAREVAGRCELPEETVQAVVKRTDGVPLFIEELTRLVLEGGAAASIPLTLHELLLARLDLLPSRQKALAQLGAVVGRAFCLNLMAAVSERDEATLRRDFAGLMEAGLLQGDERFGAPGYEFRHALFQEAAYQSLSRSTRQQYHRRIARALMVQRLPLVSEGAPEVLAHHFTEAGEHARAIGYWIRAGQLALERHGGPEAVGHLSRALELLPALAEGAPRLQAELRIRMLLSMAMLSQCPSPPEVDRMYARIQELLQQVGEAVSGLELNWWSLFSYYFMRCEFPRVRELAEWLVDVGRRHGHRGLRALGHRTLASVYFAWGRMREAAGELENALASSEEFTLEEQRALAAHYWVEPRATALAQGAMAYAMLGRLEESRRYGREALALAERLEHPHTTAFTQVYVAVACALRREVPEVLRLSEQVIELSSERRFVLWRCWATMLRGWALSELGQPREGLAILRQVLEHSRGMGTRATLPHNMMLLASVQLSLGQVREALATVEEGLRVSAETRECTADASLLRLRGECLRRLGREREALSSFVRAIAVARQQGAVLLELRAVVGLGRLLRDAGRSRVAGRLVSRILARFEGEGETLDTQEARALLSELEGTVAAPPSEEGRA